MNDTDVATLVRDAVRETHMTVPESTTPRRPRGQGPGRVNGGTIRGLRDPAGLQTRLRADGVPINVSFSGPNPACDPYYPDYRFIPPMPPRYLGKAPKYPWINSYDNGSVTESITGPSALTLVLRPARMPRGTAFEIVALRGIVVAWG